MFSKFIKLELSLNPHVALLESHLQRSTTATAAATNTSIACPVTATANTTAATTAITVTFRVIPSIC
eukprot:16561-Heterococcus_DN1.PRE.2